MAEKEATVFIIDLGMTMKDPHDADSPMSKLDWVLQYFWDKITDITSQSRKTLCVGVIGLRTDASKNKMQDEDSYQNISMLQELGPMTGDALRNLQSAIVPSDTWAGDAVSAIVLAVDMIETYTKKQKWKRTIILITDGEAAMDAEYDDVHNVTKQINSSNIELKVLGVNFDSSEYGYKEENKNQTKKSNEKNLYLMVHECEEGDFATAAAVIDDLEKPRLKSKRPYKSYDGLLTLGDPESSPDVVSIPVERYFKTHEATPPSATTIAVKVDGDNRSSHTLEEGGMNGVELTAVKSLRTYSINDPTADGGRREVEFETLEKGYEYGRTAVHMSKSDSNVTKFESFKSFQLVGFIPKSNYEPFLNMGSVGMIIAKKDNTKAELALSSLIWALSITDSLAVARLVPKDDMDPVLLILTPSLEPDVECLYDAPLPFAEDVRYYKFPPLDRVVTVGGETLTEHRFLPDEDLNEAMSDYVDAMDISTYGKDEDGNPTEYAAIENTYNPTIHRIADAIKTRAAYPDSALKDIPQILLQFCKPPEELIKIAQDRIDALTRAAEVKKVPPKAKGKRQREPVKPISGLDIDALLSSSGSSKDQVSINDDNAIPDFKRVLASATDVRTIEEAAKKMFVIVKELVSSSFGSSKYARALETLGVVREELIYMDEPTFFNDKLKTFKTELLSGTMDGDRREFWFQLRAAKLGLIDKRESELSKVTMEDAEEFYQTR